MVRSTPVGERDAAAGMVRPVAEVGLGGGGGLPAKRYWCRHNDSTHVGRSTGR
jgi:hypothetical protein